MLSIAYGHDTELRDAFVNTPISSSSIKFIRIAIAFLQATEINKFGVPSDGGADLIANLRRFFRQKLGVDETTTTQEICDHAGLVTTFKIIYDDVLMMYKRSKKMGTLQFDLYDQRERS